MTRWIARQWSANPAAGLVAMSAAFRPEYREVAVVAFPVGMFHGRSTCGAREPPAEAPTRQVRAPRSVRTQHGRASSRRRPQDGRPSAATRSRNRDDRRSRRGQTRNVSVILRWLQRCRLRHQYASAVRSVLQGHALLDRVEDGDPGTPGRILVPHVATGAESALRWGSRLTQQGVLGSEQYARDQALLNALLERTRALGG